MSQQPQMNMAAMGGQMGGPVGGAGVGTPPNSGPAMSNEQVITKLNTAIYDYLLRSEMYTVAREFKAHADVDTKPPRQSPNQRGGQQVNGIEDSMDLDSKDAGLQNKPDDLPFPASNVHGDFLRDWWFQFWEIYQAHRKKHINPATQGYMNIQRGQQGNRMAMMGNINNNQGNGMRTFNPMAQANGMNGINMQKLAQQQQIGPRNMQQIAQLQNMKAASINGQQMMQANNQMERSNSQMDNRTSSPGSGDAPSPKRQRLEGGMQQMNQGRPGPAGQLQPANQVGPLSEPPSDAAYEDVREMLRSQGHEDVDRIAPETLHMYALQTTNVQTQSMESYAQSMKRQMHAAISGVNKPDSNVSKGLPPNMGPGGAQGSPSSQQGMDGNTGEFYAATANGGGPRIPMQGAAGAAAAGQNGNGSNGNHALQDYQMQLMLLEQQNKKRLLMARQEQDNMSGHPTGHPGGMGPNGNFPPGTSPPGSQRGVSPNPNDLQRGSPTPGAGMMDVNNLPPQMRNQMMMGPNGMRPPSSHPGPAMTQAQLDMMRQQGSMMPNGQFPSGAPPQMMQPGQPGQGPQGTPRNTAMPPPPAPPNTGTGPSSPSQAPAPPTPSTTNKAKPGTKKAAEKKGATGKKNAANATAAAESAQPPTPTPDAPSTPLNPKSFGNQQMPNGQPSGQPHLNPPSGAQQQGLPQNGNAAPRPDPSAGLEPAPFGSLVDPSLESDFNLMESDMFGTGGGDIDNFDFDSFLNNDDVGLGFDANYAFDGATGDLQGVN